MTTSTLNDRELLEMAAKAAGPDFWYGEPLNQFMDRGNGNRQWNPLTDDGDALRLANTLEIDIEFHVNVEAIAWGRRENGEQRHVTKEAGLSMSATRRAIVRAAAAIGAAK